MEVGSRELEVGRVGVFSVQLAVFSWQKLGLNSLLPQ